MVNQSVQPVSLSVNPFNSSVPLSVFESVLQSTPSTREPILIFDQERYKWTAFERQVIDVTVHFLSFAS